MNRKLLLALQKRLKKRLTELRSQLEAGEINDTEMDAISAEIEEVSTELAETEEALADTDPEDGGDEEPGTGDGTNGGEEPGADGGEGDPNPEGGAGGDDPENRGGGQAGMSTRTKNAIGAIQTALSTRNAKSTKRREKEVRKAFANFVVGRISETEARTLGVETQNGSVVIPEVIATEVITYAQEENLLRKYGTRKRTNGNVKFPVLVKKATVNVVKKERHIEPNPIPETDIEFDEVYLSPAEFDALATISQKLINMSGVDVEEIVIEELKKAYVRKEANYMFNGDDPDNINPGALAKKAVSYYESEPVDLEAAGLSNKLYSQLVKVKAQASTVVRKKAIWILNGAAIAALEGLLDANGRPLLYEAPNGNGYRLLGHNVDYTDDASGADASKPVFYFGDFSKFYIQDVIGGLQIQKLVETFALTNRIGFKIYNLLDGQLVYSPFEPAVYRYEVGAVSTGA